MQRSAMVHSMEATPVFLVFGTRDILAVHNALEGVCNCKWYEQLLKKSTEKDARCLTLLRCTVSFWQFSSREV